MAKAVASTVVSAVPCMADSTIDSASIAESIAASTRHIVVVCTTNSAEASLLASAVTKLVASGA
jgi:hypothetical protein